MMIKTITPLVACSALAFSCWAQEEATTEKGSDHKIVVTAGRFVQPVSSILAPVSVVTRAEITRWQSKSVNDVLRRLPGVQVGQNGGLGQLSSLFIRGTNSSQSLILVDGIRLNQAGISGSTDLSQIPIAMVQRIEYIRGPHAAAYGSDAIGGVVNIITGFDQGSSLMGKFGSNGYQSYSGSTQQGLSENTAAALAGEYTYTKGYDVGANLPEGKKQPDRDGFLSKSLWSSVEHRFSDEWSGFARGYGYHNRSDYDGIALNTRKFYAQTFAGGVRFQQQNYSSQLIASYSRSKDYNFDGQKGPYDGSSAQDLSDQYNLQWGNTYRINQGMLSGGVDWQKRAIEPGTAYLTKGYHGYNSGVYVTGQQQLADFILEGAVRGDDNSQFGWHTTWQSNVGWEFIEDYRFIIGYGTAFKAPDFGQVYSEIYGNRNIKPEESRQWEASLEGDSRSLNWRLSAYYNDIDNLIDYKKGSKDSKAYNIGQAKIKGIEWTGELDSGPLHHELTLSYLDPRNSKTNQVLLRRAKQQVNYQLDWQLSSLDWSLNYQYMGQRYDTDTNPVTNESRRVKMGGVSLWDITVAYPLMPALTIRGRIDNLLDKNYHKVYGYRAAGREYYLSATYTF